VIAQDGVTAGIPRGLQALEDDGARGVRVLLEQFADEWLRVRRSSSRVADYASLGSVTKLYAFAAPAAMSKEIAIMNEKDLRICLSSWFACMSLSGSRVQRPEGNAPLESLWALPARPALSRQESRVTARLEFSLAGPHILPLLISPCTPPRSRIGAMVPSLESSSLSRGSVD
jgi:hypothetical protein